jgi:cystathionine beta-lyase/cystathionine gamma-synthase
VLSRETLLQQPLALGADVVVHSATKFIGGHSDLLAGITIAREQALAECLRHRRGLSGATPGALEAFLALRGLRTLALQLDRGQRNASELARYQAPIAAARGALPLCVPRIASTALTRTVALQAVGP